MPMGMNTANFNALSTMGSNNSNLLNHLSHSPMLQPSLPKNILNLAATQLNLG